MNEISSGRESLTFPAPPRGELLVASEKPRDNGLEPHLTWLEFARQLPRPFQRIFEVTGEAVLLERFIGVDGLDLVRALADAGRVLPLDVWLSLALRWGEALLHVPVGGHGWTTPADLRQLGVDVRGAVVLTFDSPNHVLGRWWVDPQPSTRAGGYGWMPESISPEAARGRPLTEATRVYGLAVTMLSLLEGRRLFHSTESVAQMLSDIARRCIDWGSPRNPACSPELEEVLRRATALTATERYTSIPEFLAVLREAAHVEPANEVRMIDVLLGVSPKMQTCLSSLEESSLPESWKAGGLQVVQDKLLERLVGISTLPTAR